MTALARHPAVLLWPAQARAAAARAEEARTKAESRVAWTIVAARTAPLLPFWVVGGVAATAADEETDSDALLIVADALVAMAVAAEAGGWTDIGRDLRALAGLPRDLAPLRAGVRS